MNDISEGKIAVEMARLIKEMSKLDNASLPGKASKLIMRLEAVYEVLVDRLDEAAGDDMTSPMAEYALTMKGLLRDLQSIHCSASIVEGKVTGEFAVRGGER